MERSRREISRAPTIRKRTAMFQQGLPGSRRSRYQKDCCARLVGKRCVGSPKEPPLGIAVDGVERILPLLSISGGLRRGIELVLLAGYACDFFQLGHGPMLFRRGAGLRGKCCNRAQSKDLLRCKSDADLRGASD